MQNKSLSFFSLIALVIGSQIGSGAFVLPGVLAPYKTIGLLGWIISVAGAISLALMFSILASHLPKNGGPHVYVREAFGDKIAFFTAWTYWIVSWASSSILLVTTMNYAQVFTGPLTSFQSILIETMTLGIITWINIIGVKASSQIETILTGMKVLPLLILPIIFFCYFDPSQFHFRMKDVAGEGDFLSIVSKTALLTFWGFIGVECATTPAESVHNPKTTIPRAIVLGTACVALVYILNTVAVIGIAGFDNLLNCKAPYVLAINKIFSNSGDIIIALLAIIVCIGSLNAWTLASGQIVVGAVADGLFPNALGKQNKDGAPVTALVVAALGMIPFFIVEEMDCWRNGLERLLDLLVSIFIFVYLICGIAYIKLCKRWYLNKSERRKYMALGICAVIFCIFVLYQDLFASILVLVLFLLCGYPIFLKYKNRLC